MNISVTPNGRKMSSGLLKKQSKKIIGNMNNW
jgi:hypothetical protein